MLKKLIVASSILVASSSMAMTNPAPYVGASLGITTNTATQFGSNSFRGVPFNLFAGYGGVVDQNFYLAGEIKGTVATANITDSSYFLKTTYGYGASILPGFMLADQTLVYGRLGVVRTRFTDQSNSLTGGEFGLGLQTSLTQNVDLRGEYDFDAYRKTTVRYSDNTVAGSLKPRSDQFTLGLVYKFD